MLAVNEVEHEFFSFNIFVKVRHISNDWRKIKDWTLLISRNGFPLQRNRMKSSSVFLVFVVCFIAKGKFKRPIEISNKKKILTKDDFYYIFPLALLIFCIFNHSNFGFHYYEGLLKN